MRLQFFPAQTEEIWQLPINQICRTNFPVFFIESSLLQQPFLQVLGFGYQIENQKSSKIHSYHCHNLLSFLCITESCSTTCREKHRLVFFKPLFSHSHSIYLSMSHCFRPFITGIQPIFFAYMDTYIDIICYRRCDL